MRRALETVVAVVALGLGAFLLQRILSHPPVAHGPAGVGSAGVHDPRYPPGKPFATGMPALRLDAKPRKKPPVRVPPPSSVN
jgi:hypothetical protein